MTNFFEKKQIVFTHENRGDRSGSFLQIDLLCYAYANFNKIKFMFLPNGIMGKKNVSCNPDRLRSFFGFNNDIDYINSDSLKFIKEISQDTLSEIDFQNKNNEIEHILKINDNTRNFEKIMLKKNPFDEYFPLNFRQHLNSNFKLTNQNNPIYFNKEMTNIAIHIRRGDVTPTRYKHAYFKNKIFIDIIKTFYKKYKNPNIHVFGCKSNSEGWDDFKSLNITLHLREDNGWSEEILIDMQHFIEADVLVIGSTFSYVPAFLNLNTVYFPNSFWHPPLNHWKLYNSSE